MSDLHLLYLTDAFPFPLTSGLLRHYFLIKELAKRHRVTLFSRVGRSFSEEHREALQPFTTRLRIFEQSPHKGLALPFQPHEDSSGPMGRAVHRLFQEDPFQAVITVKRCLGAIRPDLPVPVIGDICDAASQRIWGSMRFQPRSQLPRLLAAYWRMRRLEARTLRHCTHTLFISPRDREALLGDQTEGTSIVPNGVDTSFWKRRATVLGADNVVFTGAMDYPPNSDAALRLMGPILDRIRRSRPQAKLWIVGRDPSPRILAAAQHHPEVQVTGWVDDVRPFLDQASVFCAPLRFGAGAQNKVLEALSMEVPCVVSRLAAKGLKTEGGVDPPLTIADSEAEMGNAVTNLLHQAAPGGMPPDRAGRTFVQQHFNWRHSGALLSQVIESLVQARIE